jgi:hypothetical protein
MQLDKLKKNISEIDTYCSNSTVLLKTFRLLLKEFDLSYINSLLSKSKLKGVNSNKIFQVLFVLPFLDIKNSHQLMLSGYCKEVDFKKDVFYDFFKNERINWRKITSLFANQFLKIVNKKGDNSDSKSPICFIVDDSLLDKSGKKTEFVGKVFDHCSHTYKLGIKMLTLGCWDSKNFIPLDFSVHNEPGKNKARGLKSNELKNQFTKQRSPETAGFERVQEVSNCKIDTAISMIKRAIKNTIIPKFVLADSWFISEKFIREIQELKTKNKKAINVIGLMKSNRIISLNGKKINTSNVPEVKQKQIKFSKKMNCHYLSFSVNYKGIKMRIFWVKYKGQNSWKTLISTDETLTFIQAMKYYQIRWSIEVFFKDCKQNLSLNKCQSIDFDSFIATISICYMNYIAISLRRRFDAYETFGELFRGFNDLVLEETLIEKMWSFLITFYATILADLGVDWELFIEQLINNQNPIIDRLKTNFDCFFPANKEAA